MNAAIPETEVEKPTMKALTENESKAFLASHGFPVVATIPAATREDALRAAADLGFPVAVKIDSPDILHKSDFGGVCLNLRSSDDVGAAFDEMTAAARKRYPTATILGVTVQAMASAGQEIIIGISNDPQFGPLVMFGLGGIMVELLKDVAFRIVPLTARDAREMIREIKGFSLLTGFRGSAPVDISFLEYLLLRLSKVVETHPEIRELDLNPVIAYSTGGVIADARMILETGS